MTAPPKRRWFRFSLRTMFVVVTVFGVWLGWNLQIVRERNAVKAMVLSRGGSIVNLVIPLAPPGIAWVRRAIGDESYRNISYCGLSDDERRRMVLAFPETEFVEELEETDRLFSED